MNNNKLPIKYLINVWKILPTYPTQGDILYEIILHINKKNMSEFSMQTLNGIWYDSDGIANWQNTKIEEHIIALINDGTIIKSRTEEKSNKDWYKINNNPWI